MDAFESLVALLLQREGYWATTSFKVDLTKVEKRRIGRNPGWASAEGITDTALDEAFSNRMKWIPEGTPPRPYTSGK